MNFAEDSAFNTKTWLKHHENIIVKYSQKLEVTSLESLYNLPYYHDNVSISQCGRIKEAAREILYVVRGGWTRYKRYSK